MKQIAPYGTWTSPITAADVASAESRFGFPDFAGDEVWWQEGRPAEGGRTTIMAAGPSGAARDLLPAQSFPDQPAPTDRPGNARNRVHEYGGKSFLPVPARDGFYLVFANFADQRLYQAAAAEPAPLTPGGAGFRFADMVLSPDRSEIWCVREAHSDDGGITRAIVAVPLDGSAAADTGKIRVLVTGADFFAFPTPSPDGTKLAWINWDHPRMPWDGTELRVGPASGTTVADSTLLMGGPAESVLAPAWRDNAELYAVSDRSDWWNLYRVPAAGGEPKPLCPREEEFAGPLWQLGGRPYAVLGDGRLAVTHGTGTQQLSFLDPESGELTDTGLPYQVFGAVAASGTAIATVGGGPRTPLSDHRAHSSVVRPDGTRVVLREAEVAAPDPDYLPVPRQVALPAGPNGSTVHALVYPPSSPAYEAPAGELPPYVVWIHGGPTSKSVPLLDVEKAYFTSRGIGVIDVNYGGSTGYGRAYRERLRGQWGVVDVTDAMNAALALAEAGDADGRRLGIRGGSAGGWTALAAVTSGLTGTSANEAAGKTGLEKPGRSIGAGREVGRGQLAGEARSGKQGHPPVFAAAVSYYGVAELKSFAETTHDFESRYLDGLIGPLPEAADLYDERSPMGHVSPVTCPILLLQGLDDPIVPPSQSEAIAADLAAHGIPYAYIAFQGESHGFRKAETIIRSLESELAFYGQIMGFTPPGVSPLTLQG
jgi:dipeptidyl aminopeptidase/acylaminoacyl peptidase